MSFARTERDLLSDLLLELGPEAPTLCEGWDARDLAAHLWLRESDPLAAPGIVVKPLSGLTTRRMESAKEKLGYDDLVERVRKGPGNISLFSLPGLDEAANAIEFFVHHEDLRRAQPDWQPRELDAASEDMCWKRLGLMGRAIFRKVEGVDGLMAERTDLAKGSTPLVLRAGENPVTLKGRPSELVLFAYGRGAATRVQVEGPEQQVAALKAADLGL